MPRNTDNAVIENNQMNDQMLLADDEVTVFTRKQPTNQNLKLFISAVFLVTIAATAAALITRKVMSNAKASDSTDHTFSIDLKNITNILSVYQGNITYPSNNTYWVDVPMQLVANFTCRQLFANITAMNMFLHILSTFIGALCESDPTLEIGSSANVTVAQCKQYLVNAVSGVAAAGCNVAGLKTRLFGFSYSDINLANGAAGTETTRRMEAFVGGKS